MLTDMSHSRHGDYLPRLIVRKEALLSTRECYMWTFWMDSRLVKSCIVVDSCFSFLLATNMVWRDGPRLHTMQWPFCSMYAKVAIHLYLCEWRTTICEQGNLSIAETLHAACMCLAFPFDCMKTSILHSELKSPYCHCVDLWVNF